MDARALLSGIRVADLTWYGAGPLATRTLADWGADVIRVETPTRPDYLRRFMPAIDGHVAEVPGEDLSHGSMFNNYNRNKRSIILDINMEEGRKTFTDLVRVSDVVIENYSAGVMKRWGFDYDGLRAIREDIIYISMCGFGHSGRDMAFRTFGPLVQALGGLTACAGLPDREPSGWGMSYMDNQGGYYGTAAVLAALYHRARTGQGQYIDESFIETSITLNGPVMLDVALNGRQFRRTGNRVHGLNVAPHGVYPCIAPDSWIAISVFSDEQWVALRSELGNPEWASDPRLDTAAGRWESRDSLDERLATWTRGFEKHQLMLLLQRAGVPAGAVQTSEDLQENDPQLRYRALYREAVHPVLGNVKFEWLPVQHRTRPFGSLVASPLVGEHTDAVKELLAREASDKSSAPETAGVS